MSKRAAIVTQAEIARAIRAVHDAGAGTVHVDGKGIRIEIAAKKPATKQPPAWEMSELPRRKPRRTESG
jgi:hypothetical protein